MQSDGDITVNNIDSEDAASGTVLTSDGAGRTVWSTPSSENNRYSAFTDGTTTTAANGSDVFKIRAGSNKIGVVVQDGDITHGDNLSIDVNQANLTLAQSQITGLETALSGKSDTSHTHSGVYEPANANIQSHISSITNPHSVTKAQVGLSNVDNTADASKNVLSATKLTTARTIDGQSFDGTANITVVKPTLINSPVRTAVLNDNVSFIFNDPNNGYDIYQTAWSNIKSSLYGTANTWTAKNTFGDVEISGTGKRITGDFSAAALGDRVCIQTTLVNGLTEPWVIPNGTAVTAGIGVVNSSLGTNCSYADFIINNSNLRIRSGAIGTGTALPIDIQASAGITFNGAGNMPGYKNLLVNGGFNVSPRGDGPWGIASSGSIFGPTNWYFFNGLNSGSDSMVVSRVAGASARSKYGVKIQRKSGSAATGTMRFASTLELIDSYKLRSKSITVSFTLTAGSTFVANGSSFSGVIRYQTGATEDTSANNVGGAWSGAGTVVLLSCSPTTTTTRFQFTGTVPANSTQIGLYCYTTHTGTAGSDDSITIEQVQIEEGSAASAFEMPPYQIELAQCQRYLPTSSVTAIYEPLGTGQCLSSTVAKVVIPFKVSARTKPTGISVSAAGDFYLTNSSGGVISATSIVIDQSNIDFVMLTVTVASGLVAGNSTTMLAANSNARLWCTGSEL